MTKASRFLRQYCLAIFCAVLPFAATADNPAQALLADKLRNLETRHTARIGVMIRDASSAWHWGYRENERFLMNSTFKSALCGAILDQVDRNALDLNTTINITRQDILHYAPVTRRHIGGALSIGALCFATLDKSDNTAANLLIDVLGGPQQVTAYLRSIGDMITRLDRREPSLNLFVAGDPRDTTTPAAITSTWQKLLTGNALQPASRAQLAAWMRQGSVTQELLRKSLPIGWQAVDKSGGGRDHTRSLVAMVTTPSTKAYLIAIYVSDTPSDWKTRNALVAEISAAVIGLIATR